MMQLFLIQLFGHMLGDFYMQCECMCSSKTGKGLKSGWLYVHVLLIFLVAWGVTWTASFWWAAMLIAIMHGVADGIKSYLTRIKKMDNWLFWLDQLIHVVVIGGTVWLYYCCCGWDEWQWLTSYRAVMIDGFVFCLWPANFFIGEFLKKIKVEKKGPNGEVNNVKSTLDASRVIGSIERILVFLFVWLGQYSSIGFLIAAKSVMRFPERGKDDGGNNAEYYLVGSLLSFGVSIMMAASILALHKKGIL